jgi:hypothetical protein
MLYFPTIYVVASAVLAQAIPEYACAMLLVAPSIWHFLSSLYIEIKRC